MNYTMFDTFSIYIRRIDGVPIDIRWRLLLLPKYNVFMGRAALFT